MTRTEHSRHLKPQNHNVTGTDSMIAYCGLDCGTCPIHLATLEQDRSKQQAMRIEIAHICSQQYHINISPEDVTDCDGCRSRTGILFSGCARCEIRSCATERKVSSCAFCVDYACQTLSKHFETDAGARTRLEAMRRVP